MLKDGKILGEGKPGLTSIIRAVGTKSMVSCEACGTQLKGLERVLIHPADAVIDFSYWKMLPGPATFQFRGGEEVQIHAREWVDRGQAIFELMDGTFHEFAYSPQMTRLETERELVGKEGLPRCVPMELDDTEVAGHDTGEDYGLEEETFV